MANDSGYPNNIDNFGTVVDNQDYVEAKHINQLNDAVNKIETELGTNPKGSYDNVKTTLEACLKNENFTSNGLMKRTGEATYGITTDNSTNWDTAYTNSGKVKVDTEATPDYIGNNSADGILRTSSPITYTDGGDYITLAIQDATTTQKGTVQLQDSIDTTNTTAATPNAVKEYVDASGGGGPDTQNLTVTYATASTVDIDADYLQCMDMPLSSINLTLDITTDGINGAPKTTATGTARSNGGTSSTTVQGSGTSFTTEFTEGDVIYFDTDAVGRRITTITDNTTMTVESAFTVSDYRNIYRGGEAPNTWYAVCIAYNPTTETTGAILFPTEANSNDNGVPKTSRPPILPSGYTKWRHIGWVRNDSNSDFYDPAYCIAGTNIVDRGLPASADWAETGSKTVLNTDGNYHEFTSPAVPDIVPPGAKAIEFKCYLIDNAAGYRIILRGYNRASYTAPAFRIVVANQSHEYSSNVFPDYMRRVEYEGSNTAFTGIYISVKSFIF